MNEPTNGKAAEIKRNKLLSWLNEIHLEVVSMFHHLAMFHFTRDTYDTNPKLKTADSTIYHWIMKSAAVDLVIRVARLCEENRDTESMVQFLQALKGQPELLSRERYVSLYKDDHAALRELADEHFDNLAGSGEKSFPIQKIDADIKTLTKEAPCKKITDYRNQYVAHLSKQKDPSPLYDALFDATQKISEMTKKYYLLLTASNVMTHTPTPQGDWQYPYTIPWISRRN